MKYILLFYSRQQRYELTGFTLLGIIARRIYCRESLDYLEISGSIY